MKLLFAGLLTSVTLAGSLSAAFACNHDIECPVQWVWSDDEGTCVEDSKGTS